MLLVECFGIMFPRVTRFISPCLCRSLDSLAELGAAIDLISSGLGLSGKVGFLSRILCPSGNLKDWEVECIGCFSFSFSFNFSFSCTRFFSFSCSLGFSMSSINSRECLLSFWLFWASTIGFRKCSILFWWFRIALRGRGGVFFLEGISAMETCSLAEMKDSSGYSFIFIIE